MFAIHDVFKPAAFVPKIDGPVRVLETVGFEKVILIEVCEKAHSVPFAVNYRAWSELIASGALELATDPYMKFSSRPGNLPEGAKKRYIRILKVTEILMQDPHVLHTPRRLAAAIFEIAQSMGLHGRTVKRWVCEWLKSGRNPAAVIRKLIARESGQSVKPQVRGKKRGVKGRVPEFFSDAPSHEIMDKVKTAWNLYVIKQQKKWADAYHDMLIEQYQVPAEAFSSENEGYFLNRDLLEKYRAPTWVQTRYRFRLLKQAAFKRDLELPQGKRGKAADDVFGPGFFEIDATHFQIQLVSRLTKGKLVGRPSVYLIVDIWSNAITGYSLTLENPSWATAALALHNCFTSKKATFDRLNLPYEDKDWPCQELPNMLRADRAELVSNMGQEFPGSGIRVETPPPMNPEAKGTVEGKHSEVKKPRPSRFDLPGRFAKIRKRRDPDGKKAAALDIFEFERILVEIIMDINREPVEARKIPLDALSEGAKVASRIGFYEWGLTHRPGFTREMAPNFIYEHLLTKAKGRVTPQGIHVRGEIFTCDHLLKLGYLAAAIDDDIKVSVSYNPLLATEIYFYDLKSGVWEPAHNIDPEIYRLKVSFSEAENYRSWQKLLTKQAALDAHIKRRTRLPFVRQSVKNALKEKRETTIKTSMSKANIRENRAQERANERFPGLNGILPLKPSLEFNGKLTIVNTADTPAKSSHADRLKQLWGKVDASSKN